METIKVRQHHIQKNDAVADVGGVVVYLGRIPDFHYSILSCFGWPRPGWSQVPFKIWKLRRLAPLRIKNIAQNGD